MASGQGGLAASVFRSWRSGDRMQLVGTEQCASDPTNCADCAFVTATRITTVDGRTPRTTARVERRAKKKESPASLPHYELSFISSP